jgi:hypothetical protein
MMSVSTKSRQLIYSIQLDLVVPRWPALLSKIMYRPVSEPKRRVKKLGWPSPLDVSSDETGRSWHGRLTMTTSDSAFGVVILSRAPTCREPISLLSHIAPLI